jgi:prevent-host-death family protein
MKTVNIHSAKTHLSRLVEEAAAGEPFLIAKAGKPLVKVVPIEMEEPRPMRRRGFLAGQIDAPPNDFNSMFAEEILEMFGLNEP